MKAPRKLIEPTFSGQKMIPFFEQPYFSVRFSPLMSAPKLLNVGIFRKYPAHAVRHGKHQTSARHLNWG
jgi:hypothetical protein